jgi:hypothetical protein
VHLALNIVGIVLALVVISGVIYTAAFRHSPQRRRIGQRVYLLALAALLAVNAIQTPDLRWMNIAGAVLGVGVVTGEAIWERRKVS